MRGWVFPFVNGVLRREETWWRKAFPSFIMTQTFLLWQWHWHIHQWNKLHRDLHAALHSLSLRNKKNKKITNISDRFLIFLRSYITIPQPWCDVEICPDTCETNCQHVQIQSYKNSQHHPDKLFYNIPSHMFVLFLFDRYSGRVTGKWWQREDDLQQKATGRIVFFLVYFVLYTHIL